jgi:hypothetical protein
LRSSRPFAPPRTSYIVRWSLGPRCFPYSFGLGSNLIISFLFYYEQVIKSVITFLVIVTCRPRLLFSQRSDLVSGSAATRTARPSLPSSSHEILPRFYSPDGRVPMPLSIPRLCSRTAENGVSMRRTAAAAAVVPLADKIGGRMPRWYFRSTGRPLALPDDQEDKAHVRIGCSSGTVILFLISDLFWFMPHVDVLPRTSHAKKAYATLYSSTFNLFRPTQ